jgi:hypothetical protein
MTQLSHFFSWLFLPLLMPLYALLIVMFVPTSPVDMSEISPYGLPLHLKWVLWTVFLIFCFIAPGLSFYGLYRFKIITTLDMESRLERRIPLLIMLGYNLILIWFIYQSDPQGILPKVFMQLPLAGLFVTVLFTVITSWIKISMHAGGAGILTGFLYAYFGQVHNPSLGWICASVIMAGLVIAARWYLQKHTALELFLGYVLAGLITFEVVHFFD